MKKTILSGLLLILIVLFAFMASLDLMEEGPTEEWVARYNGPGNSIDYGGSLTTDEQGNIFVTGLSTGVGTDFDFATIKYDKNGNLVWEARYNGPGNGYDSSVGVVTDSSGNVYVGGWSMGDGTGYDFATIKYDKNGNQLWVARYNGPANDYDRCIEIAVDSEGNVYATGTSLGIGTGTDLTTIKYDTFGNQLWVSRYNNPLGISSNLGYGLAIDSMGNVYVTGRSTGSGTHFDAITIKYNNSGEILWAARYDGPGHDWEDFRDIAIDQFGNVYVTGASDGGGGMNRHSGYDYALIKYDSVGNQLWVARYNGDGNDYDFSVAIFVDKESNIYITGCSFEAGPQHDMTTIKYDSFGNPLWIAKYNGPGNNDDHGHSVTGDSKGNIYVTGLSVGIDSKQDFVTIKYDRLGNERWVARYNGPGNDIDYAGSIALDSFGDIVVTGLSFGTATDFDFATIKYSQKLEPDKQIEELIEEVENLVNAGLLNQGQGTALVATLSAAINLLRDGNVTACCSQLRAFINQINAFVNTNLLPPEEGQALIDAANRVINELCE